MFVMRHEVWTTYHSTAHVPLLTVKGYYATKPCPRPEFPWIRKWVGSTAQRTRFVEAPEVVGQSGSEPNSGSGIAQHTRPLRQRSIPGDHEVACGGRATALGRPAARKTRSPERTRRGLYALGGSAMEVRRLLRCVLHGATGPIGG